MKLCPRCEQRELARVNDDQWWCFTCGWVEQDAAALRPGSSVTEEFPSATVAAGGGGAALVIDFAFGFSLPDERKSSAMLPMTPLQS